MHFRSQYLLPMAVLITSALAALWGGLLWLTTLQNELEAQSEIRRTARSFQAEVDRIGTISRVFAVWDDAAAKLVLTLDHAWAKSYEVDYLREAYGYTATFITDAGGKPLFAYVNGQPTGIQPSQFFGNAYDQAMESMLRAGPKSTEPIPGLTSSPYGLKVFGIVRIRPHSDNFTERPLTVRYLVVARPIDKEMLSDLSRNGAAAGLTISASPRSTGPGSWQLKAFDRRPAAALLWTPANPGSRVFLRTVPWLVALGCLIIVLAVAVLMRASRAARQLEASETKARYVASRDSLTGLPNRRAFSRELLRIERMNGSICVLYMDLDGFKKVNDTFGHGVGDNLLRRTAERLQQHLPSGSMLARLGGDEFAIAITEPIPGFQLAELARRLIDAVNEPYQFGGAPTQVGVSIGIANAQGHGHEELISHADTAMYAAKSRGRNGWAFYHPDLDTKRGERKVLEQELRQALVQGDITLVYQPVVSIRDGRIVSVEALARWSHPVLGPISPDVFIPIAEESGLIVELGNFILETACTAAKDWPFKLAVNLSPAQFWSHTLIDDVTRIVTRHGFPPERLEFEITETYLLSRPELAKEIVTRLRALGIGIALDDFGSGYASIGYLRMFDLDLVKIDRSLVEGLGVDRAADEVLSAIVALCRAMRLEIIAEGVETQVQANILRAAGCEFMQGWHFSYPVPAEDVPAQFFDQYRIAA